MRGRSIDRVAEAASNAGLEIEILAMPESTRTASEAASACRCSEAQIVKSLVFRKSGTEELILLLVAGDRQVDLNAAAQAVGAELERADPKLVREVSGFAIGGVAPLGHRTRMPVFMDPQPARPRRRVGGGGRSQRRVQRCSGAPSGRCLCGVVAGRSLRRVKPR